MERAIAHPVGRVMIAASALAWPIAVDTVFATMAHATALTAGVVLTALRGSFAPTTALDTDAAKTSPVLVTKAGWAMTVH